MAAVTVEGGGTPAADRFRGAGRRLRRLLQEDGQARPVCAVGAVNALAATVAAESGFDALWLSGLELSAASGLPDANLLTVRHLVDAANAVTAVTELPLVVDVDNAGGSATAARRYALDLVRAGVAAVCVEDSAYPKCNSFSAHRDQLLADTELTCAQIDAMRRAAGEDLVIVARTESLICGQELPEALDRAARYAEAGADSVLVHSKDSTGRQALAVAGQWTGGLPLTVIPTAFPALSLAELGVAGFRLCIYANQLSRVALAAMRTAAVRFLQDGTFGDPAEMAPVGDLMRVADPDALSTI